MFFFSFLIYLRHYPLLRYLSISSFWSKVIVKYLSSLRRNPWVIVWPLVLNAVFHCLWHPAHIFKGRYCFTLSGIGDILFVISPLRPGRFYKLDKFCRVSFTLPCFFLDMYFKLGGHFTCTTRCCILGWCRRVSLAAALWRPFFIAITTSIHDLQYHKLYLDRGTTTFSISILMVTPSWDFWTSCTLWTSVPDHSI